MIDHFKSDLESIDFLIALKPIRNDESYFYPYLYIYIILAGAFLKNEDSNMILKIGHTFNPRTNELIYLIYCMFDKINITRPCTSNLYSNVLF